MGNQQIRARIYLDGWLGPETAAVGDDLILLQILVKRQFATIKFDPKCESSIRLIEIGSQKIQDPIMAYESMHRTTVDISDPKNWVVTDRAIILKTGKTCYGADTHFTVAFSTDFSKVPIEATISIIANAVSSFLSE